MRVKALLSLLELFLASPVMAQDQPCQGVDGGVYDVGPTEDQLAYIAKRFELVCNSRNPEQGLKSLHLFTEPNMKSAIADAPMAAYFDMIVDQMVATDGEQFLGGWVFTPTRCPLVQFVLPDGKGGTKRVDHWFMLATDLNCLLKQPGEE